MLIRSDQACCYVDQVGVLRTAEELPMRKKKSAAEIAAAAAASPNKKAPSGELSQLFVRGAEPPSAMQLMKVVTNTFAFSPAIVLNTLRD